MGNRWVEGSNRMLWVTGSIRMLWGIDGWLLVLLAIVNSMHNKIIIMCTRII